MSTFSDIFFEISPIHIRVNSFYPRWKFSLLSSMEVFAFILDGSFRFYPRWKFSFLAVAYYIECINVEVGFG